MQCARLTIIIHTFISAWLSTKLALKPGAHGKKKQVVDTICLTKHEKKAFKIHFLSSMMNLLWGLPDLSLRPIWKQLVQPKDKMMQGVV